MTITMFVLVNAVSAKREPIPPVTIPTADFEGSKDHPILKRFAGSYIVGYQKKSFDEFTFPLSKIVQIGRIKSDGFSPNKKKTVEGPYTRLVYLMPAEASPLEIKRNYQDEILGLGGNVLYECTQGRCGGEKDKGIIEHRRKTSLATFLRPLNKLGMKEWGRGYCATTSPISDQRYLVAELPDTGMHISIHTYNLKKRRDYINCEAFTGRTVIVVDIVEGKPLKKNMVVVKAGEMAKEISAKGSVSLYGIFFDTNKSAVKEDSEQTLREIARLMQQQAGMKLLVVGHTDNEGTFEYNMNLSKSRALAVVEVLSTKYGVPRERLSPVGVSYAGPVSSNTTKEGQALNRRVELVQDLGK
jgi:flagellar motor protein MotB